MINSAGTLAGRLYDFLREEAAARRIAAVGIGAIYMAVRLDNGALGLAAAPVTPWSPVAQAAVFPPEESLPGRPAAALLAWLTEGGDPWRTALALATANALIRQERSDFDGDPLDHFQLTAADRVVMVGRFTPLLTRIEATGAALTVLEKDPAKGMVLTPGDRRGRLQDCTLAIITATALLYGDLEDILADLGAPRLVSLLGPSTPMLPPLFAGTPVTHLGGVRIREAAAVLDIVAAGGGTRAMRPFLEMTNLFLKG